MTNNLKDLEEKIAAFKGKERDEKSTEEKEQEAADNMSRGIRAGSELLVSIAAGVLIGLLLDNWLGTKPLFLIIFILGGISAGFMNVYRLTQNFDSSIGFKRLPSDQKDAKKTPKNEN